VSTQTGTDAHPWRLEVDPDELAHIAAILRVEDLPLGYDWTARRELLASKIDGVRAILWPEWEQPRRSQPRPDKAAAGATTAAPLAGGQERTR
jgi:hypothetical protein